MLSIAVCDDEIIECCSMAAKIRGILEDICYFEIKERLAAFKHCRPALY